MTHELDEYRYNAVLVGLSGVSDAEITIEESLDELERLLDTDGGRAVARLVQPLNTPHPTHYVGIGKAQELKALVATVNANCVLFDDELTPRQQSTLQEFFGETIVILDRTALILEIFAQHATTREGKLQVELATLQYQLPRLRGMWSHLEKEKLGSGVGARFGAGESQLESDRRIARRRMADVKKQLDIVKKDRLNQRSQRLESLTFRVSLVGYTNAGKSSLLNGLTGADVLAYDKLFATLDSTTRKLELPHNRVVTLTDTVGFIHKLPHQLVAAFRSTLEEITDAQLLLHVVDAGSPQRDMMMTAVLEVLEEIGAHTLPALLVFNKIDTLQDEELALLKRRYPQAIFVSALEKEGFEDLLRAIQQAAAVGSVALTVLVPFSEGRLLELAHTSAQVISQEYTDQGVLMNVLVPSRLVHDFEAYRQEDAQSLPNAQSEE